MLNNELSHLSDDLNIISSLFRKAALKPVVNQYPERTYFNAESIDLNKYHHIIVCHSGGKDSWAALIKLKEIGADMSKVEIWHHAVDGKEGSNLMDWIFMDDYLVKLAGHFGVPVYFSWLEGGMEREMLKHNAPNSPHIIQTPDGEIVKSRKQFEKVGDAIIPVSRTRLQFPQQSASLATRWCSSSLKIDVGRRAITSQDRFVGKNVLFITGERREESANRAKYNQLEKHQTDAAGGKLERLVDAWRPVLNWSEEDVWSALERNRIIAPVPYRLGWSRSSCMTCIFNGPKIWSTINEYFPERIKTIADYEKQFGVTISRKKIGVTELAKSVSPIKITDTDALAQAMSKEYTLPIVNRSGDTWIQPSGAFSKEACGSL